MVKTTRARSRTDKLLAEVLKLAEKALEERASAEDLEELAAVVIELDEAVTIDGAPAPKRWAAKPLPKRDV